VLYNEIFSSPLSTPILSYLFFSLFKISTQFQYLQFPFIFFKKVENVEDGED